MTISAKVLTLLIPIALLGACTTLSDEDQAKLNRADQNAATALATSQRAEATANRAAADAAKAAQSAQQANEKADRMFQRNLRK